ncbi:MAG: aspartyl/glutamyl-tRNA amidotransferase subunit C [Candidatus Gracilibacteria bacterium]|nr:aspartyl/glutamyl-tRNA amidotransferase subunit C [Candidatus Gracilibacteria bacterium]
MTLTQDQIKKLSESLTKIKNEDPKLAQDVSSIIDYIDLLEEVDTDDVEATVSVVHQENTLRADIETEKITSPQELLKCSQQKIISGQIAVSNIMK